MYSLLGIDDATVSPFTAVNTDILDINIRGHKRGMLYF